jgi:hypothetical protein
VRPQLVLGADRVVLLVYQDDLLRALGRVHLLLSARATRW